MASAQTAWEKAVALLRDPSIGLVILDELNVVLNYDYLPLATVLDEHFRMLEEYFAEAIGSSWEQLFGA